MTFPKTAIFAALVALFSVSANAQDFKAGNLSIAHPHSFATPPGTSAAAGYLTITNTGAEADRLIGVASEFRRTMIHKSQMEDGVMKMRHQKAGVTIPAGGTVAFEPGGLHIMFLGLEQPLKEGQTARATLRFEKSGDVDIILNVKKRKLTSDTTGHRNHGAQAPKEAIN